MPAAAFRSRGFHPACVPDKAFESSKLGGGGRSRNLSCAAIRLARMILPLASEARDTAARHEKKAREHQLSFDAQSQDSLSVRRRREPSSTPFNFPPPARIGVGVLRCLWRSSSSGHRQHHLWLSAVPGGRAPLGRQRQFRVNRAATCRDSRSPTARFQRDYPPYSHSGEVP